MLVMVVIITILSIMLINNNNNNDNKRAGPACPVGSSRPTTLPPRSPAWRACRPTVCDSYIHICIYIIMMYIYIYREREICITTYLHISYNHPKNCMFFGWELHYRRPPIPLPAKTKAATWTTAPRPHRCQESARAHPITCPRLLSALRHHAGTSSPARPAEPISGFV